MGVDSLGILFSVNGETCALIIFKQAHHSSGDCENNHHKIKKIAAPVNKKNDHAMTFYHLQLQ